MRGALLIVFAVCSAVGAALLLTRYMDAKTAAARVPTAKVVVARIDIPVASPLQLEWLTTIDWPQASIPEGASRDPANLVGQVAVHPISRGEAVLVAKLAQSGARGGLATLLPAEMRAAAVRVDDVVGVAGFIYPGDRVDVLVTMKPKDDAQVVSKIVLENVKVLTVGKDIEYRAKDPQNPKPVTVATLMVSAEESERLWLAASEGKILLTLRGMGDEELVATKGVTPTLLLGSAVPPPPKPVAVAEGRRPAVKAQPVPPAKTTPKQTVEILRGDLFEKRVFAPAEDRN